jgi:hypothetical protein
MAGQPAVAYDSVTGCGEVRADAHMRVPVLADQVLIN